MAGAMMLAAAAPDPDENAGVIHYPETGQSLRWVRHDGIVWLHFGDLCKGTGHSNSRSAIHLIEDEDKKKIDMRDLSAGQSAVSFFTAVPTSGNAEAWFVTEDGFITLGLAGRGDGPRMFRRWVVKVVIPQFRRQTSTDVAQRPDGDLDALQAMVAALREQRAEMRAQAQRVSTVEAKVAAIEGQYDWFTALAFARLHGHPTNRPYLAKVGSKAGRLLRARGEQPVKRQDATFGSINTYPADVLAEAFEAVRS